MSIEAVKKLAESWLAEAKSLDENASITQQWSGVPLKDEQIANRKAVAYQHAEYANAVLVALAKHDDVEPKAAPIKLPDLASAGENLVNALAWRIEQRWPGMHEAVRVSYQRSAEKFLAPYIARIAELERCHESDAEFAERNHVLTSQAKRITELESRFAMPEPSASPNHEFVFGSAQSMRIRVWNETSRAVCIVDFDGVADPAGYIAAFVAGLSPLGDHPEARRGDVSGEPKAEQSVDPHGSVERYLADGGKWD
jgi:plasmid stabilization system protein ParE